MKLYRLVTALTFLLFLKTTASFSNPSLDFKKANEFYSKGNYQKAKELYLGIIKSNYTSAELCFNIGNCLYKTDSLAGAILFYERALKLNPKDEDIQLNLQIANGKTVDKIEPMPKLFIATYWIDFISLCSTNLWAIITIAISFICVAFLFLFYFSGSEVLKRVFFFSGLLLFVLMCFTLATTFYSNNYFNNQNNSKAVVFEEVINVKSAPNEGSVNLFNLHLGTTVHIKEREQKWVRIKIDNGNEGWIEETAIRNI